MRDGQMRNLTRKDAGDTLVKSASALCKELLIKRMRNDSDKRGMEFVLTMLETACTLVIETVSSGKIPSKLVLVRELTKRCAAAAKLMNADNANMVACIVSVTELAMITAESAQTTVLAAQATTSAVTATAVVPTLSAMIAIGGTLLTSATACAAAYELVQALMVTLDSCKAVIVASPQARSVVAAYNPIEGSSMRMTVVT